MKIPIAAVFNSLKSVVKKHGPEVMEVIADKAGREILKALKKKIRGRR
jgi:hypothetical protein